MPENNIIIRQGDIINTTTIKEASIEVIGSISGVHSGEFFLSDDMRTLIFIPLTHFTPGEKVNVKVYGGIYTANGDMLSPITFDFYMCPEVVEKDEYTITNKLSDCKLNFNQENVSKSVACKLNSETGLPEDFPPITINTLNNPSPGYLFFAPYMLTTFVGYLIIMDNNGVPIFYERTPYERHALQIQQNRWLTYGDTETRYFYLMDSSYSVVDSFTTGNGYPLNMHEFQLLPNEHALLIATDPQIIRMDTVVAGGDTAALVLGAIIQEVDASKNVIFQWRSWDHYQITDATENINLTAHTIDYVHANAVELDNDGNILLSSRHMDEITKINRQTGEIIWRWGGEKSRNNQFQFINDTRTFSHQHDIRRLPNGNVTLYDNGNLHIPKYSRAVEYQLDETNKIATLVWDYRHEEFIYNSAQGNVNRLSNNSTIIGWGGWFYDSDIRAISEVRMNGLVDLEISIPDSFTNYQAFKFPWKTNLLTADNYSVDFEYIPVSTIDTKEIVITNNSDEELQLTSYYSSSSLFSVVDNFPITLQPYQNKILQIQFSPDSIGVFSDDIHLRMQKEYEMIAQVINVLGSSDPSDSLEIENNIPSKFSLTQNYPNPFNPVTTISYSIPTQSQVSLRVYNSIGENIADLINVNQAAGSYEINWDAGNVASGIYFYSIKAIPADGTEIFRSVMKMILLK
jgi:hypothetical protein